MKLSLIQHLQCPNCDSFPLAIEQDKTVDDEIESGSLECSSCEHTYEISDGIPLLVEHLDVASLDELRSRERLTPTPEWEASVRAAGDYAERWIFSNPQNGDRIAELPVNAHEHAFGVADFGNVLQRVRVDGRRVLDIGAGNAWTSRALARKGAECVAVDLVPTFLRVGRAHFDAGVYFHRVSANMNHIPVRDGTFGAAFSCASIHHSSDLAATFREIHRVLEPGGQLVLAAEPIAGQLRNYDASLSELRRSGLNENMYSRAQFLDAARSAGFRARILFPASFGLQISGVLPHPPSLKIRLARHLPRALNGVILELGQRFIGISLSAVFTKAH